MLPKIIMAGSTAFVLGAIAAAAMPTAAHAMTSTECSAKYKAAKAANTLNGMTWAEFRKAQCAGTEPAATTPPPADTKPAADTAKPAADTAKPAANTAKPSDAKFPSAVDAKYAKESAGRARMHTCRDQYEANKAGNGNGGLHWIQKGGGYYSECNKHLKG